MAMAMAAVKSLFCIRRPAGPSPFLVVFLRRFAPPKQRRKKPRPRPCGSPPDVLSSNLVITQCARDGRVADARCAFDSMARRDLVSWNAMLSAYARNAQMEDALHLFDAMPAWNVVSWTTLIVSYTDCGQPAEALAFFHRMDAEGGVVPDRITFLGVLAACAALPALNEGKWIHAQITRREPAEDPLVGNALVDMYGKCGSLVDARKVFDRMHCRNAVSWTSLLVAYARKQMLAEARSVFEEMPKRDVIAWNAMITAYVQSTEPARAMELYCAMDVDGGKGNKFTLSSVLDACADLARLDYGKVIHAAAVNRGCETDVVVGTAVVKMYGVCQRPGEAGRVFERMTSCDQVAWTAVIAAYARNGRSEDALAAFGRMCADGGSTPDKVTFLGVLDACAGLGALGHGEAVHRLIVGGKCDTDLAVNNALVNMYGKCGSPDRARRIFDAMPHKDLVSWNAMLAVYAHNSKGPQTLQFFKQFLTQGSIRPDAITFIAVLYACSHSGLPEDGMRNFASMYRTHGIIPDTRHYVCMIDLLGRLGRLDEAEGLLAGIPFEDPFTPITVGWTCLVGACKVHNDVERASWAASHLFELDPNMDKALGETAKDRGSDKGEGHNGAKPKNNVHRFLAGDWHVHRYLCGIQSTQMHIA